jgi:hypothetical protein
MDSLAYTLDDFSIPWFPMDCKLWLSNHACHCPARSKLILAGAYFPLSHNQSNILLVVNSTLTLLWHIQLPPDHGCSCVWLVSFLSNRTHRPSTWVNMGRHRRHTALSRLHRQRILPLWRGRGLHRHIWSNYAPRNKTGPLSNRGAHLGRVRTGTVSSEWRSIHVSRQLVQI